MLFRLLFVLSRFALLAHLALIVLSIGAATNGYSVALPIVTVVLFVAHVFVWRKVLGRALWKRDVKRSQYWQAVHREAGRRNRS